MLGIYIHIPFCVQKCHYCGFFSTIYDRPVADAFLSALGQEMDGQAPLMQNSRFKTVYIGGGTPSVLTEGQLSRLFDLIDEQRIGTGAHEITVEANPVTITPAKLTLLRSRGVTRLSLGVQSFSDEVLASLGRLHTASEAAAAFRAARSAGFGNIGLDLIYGIPGQSEQQWLETVASAVALGPEHLSIYSLSLDDGSRLSRDAAAGLVQLPDDETSAAQYAAAVRCLIGSGYEQYEISNFCRPGHACQHNGNYWRRGEYIGLGPGAWSSLGNRRCVNVPSVHEYLSRVANGSPLASFEELLDRDQQAAESILLGLRTAEGIDLDRYEMHAGKAYADTMRRRLAELSGTGLFGCDGTKV